jgi:hypothetical protein
MRRFLGGISGSRPSGQANLRCPDASRIDPGRIAKGAGFLLKIYTCHLLVFTIGAAVGAFLGMNVTVAVFTAMLKSRGLL